MITTSFKHGSTIPAFVRRRSRNKTMVNVGCKKANRFALYVLDAMRRQLG
jgi:hypothetical protein